MDVSRLRRRSLRAGIAVPLSVALLLLLALVYPGLALPGSTFEGSDGNLVVNTAGNTDWSNAPNRVRGDDVPSGTGDNAFGQGTKEDDENVSVVTGSIPPNKSDLTRFYVANEFANNSNYLYLAWERSNVLGSANMDFEINQKTQPNLTTTGPKTLNRTAGDLLITFDFTNGGGNPVLGLLKWVTSGPTSQCFSRNALPCWGNRVNLSAAGFAEGAVNTSTVDDPIAGVSLPGLTFGEAAVNLTAAGVFGSTCEAFASAFLKSRSSASFPAEVKDFVAPRPVSISNCGTITIHKITENGDSTFDYTTTGALTPATFSLSNGGTRTYSDVVAGSYSVTESAPPAGWTLKSLECTATGDGTSVTPSDATASITMAGGGTVDCTYTNHINLKPTIATKLSAESVTVGATVHDSATLHRQPAGCRHQDRHQRRRARLRPDHLQQRGDLLLAGRLQRRRQQRRGHQRLPERDPGRQQKPVRDKHRPEPDSQRRRDRQWADRRCGRHGRLQPVQPERRHLLGDARLHPDGGRHRERHLLHDQHDLHRQGRRHLALAGDLQRRRQQRKLDLAVRRGALHHRQRHVLAQVPLL